MENCQIKVFLSGFSQIPKNTLQQKKRAETANAAAAAAAAANAIGCAQA
jgi:hypothetical protein